MVEQKTIGLISTVLLIVGYIYFTVWVMITPLIDEDQSIQAYFPERKWAFIVPIYSGCVFLSLVLTFTGLALIFEKNSHEKIKAYKKRVMENYNPSQAQQKTSSFASSLNKNYSFLNSQNDHKG